MRPLEGDGVAQKGGIRKDVEKWLKLGYILRMEPIKLIDGLDVV